METFLDKFPFTIMNRVWGKFISKTTPFNALKHRIISNFIKRNVPDTPNADYSASYSGIDTDVPIYFMWLQGKENMPDIPLICYNNLLQKRGNHPIIFISEDNIYDVLDVNKHPELKRVVEWYERGIISMQYFADICRTNLLYSKGGIWMDATLFITENIDSIIGDYVFYSGKRDPKICGNYYPAKGLWTSYFICSGKNNPLMKFVFNGLVEFIDRYGKIEEYFTMDYLFKLAYDNISPIRRMIDSIENVPSTFFDLSNNLSSEYSEELYNKLMHNSKIYKLTWKADFPDNTEGKLTLKGFLKENFKMN